MSIIPTEFSVLPLSAIGEMCDGYEFADSKSSDDVFTLVLESGKIVILNKIPDEEVFAKMSDTEKLLDAGRALEQMDTDEEHVSSFKPIEKK
jgi:hypothetical protein